MNNREVGQTAAVYIALGSNLGDRKSNLKSAILQMAPGITVLQESPVYQTAPWGYKDQPPFLNQVILAETNSSPLDLLAHLKDIEAQMGRTPTFRYGPREVDLDILFYGDLIFEDETLRIPHPRLQERAFVLVPLSDLNPVLRHPVSGLTVREMLSKIEISGITRFRS